MHLKRSSADVIADGVDRLLIEQTPTAIVDAICYLLLNPSDAQLMGKVGQQKVKENFTWTKLAQKTEEAYQKAFMD